MQELCQRLKCSETKVRALIAEHQFPPPFLFGKTPSWWEADIIAYEWLASRGSFNQGPAPEWGEEEDDPPESPQRAPKRPKSPQSPPSST